MANNTWKGATNEVLELAQLDPILNDSDFNNPTGALSKYQRAARAFIRLGHYHLSLRAYKHFAERRIPLNIDESTPTYPIDTGINPEHIKFRKFFNVSTGTNAAQNQEIRYYDYDRFLRENPDQSKIPTGPPERWILLPIERTDLSPVHKVRIYPNPDDNYNLEFQAALNTYPLATASDIILWPPEYEFVLWEFAWDLLERGLGEGKEGRIAQMAQEAASQVYLVAGRPQDERKKLRLMHLPGRFRNSTQYVSSPRSVDDGGSVID
jgi:hypothetical protein